MLIPRSLRVGLIMFAVVVAGLSLEPSLAQVPIDEFPLTSLADCDALGKVLLDPEVAASADTQFSKGPCFGTFASAYNLPGVASGWRGRLVFGPLASTQTTSLLTFQYDETSGGAGSVRYKLGYAWVAPPEVARILIADARSYTLLADVLSNTPAELVELFNAGYTASKICSSPTFLSSWSPDYRVTFTMTNGVDSANVRVRAMWSSGGFSVPVVTVD